MATVPVKPTPEQISWLLMGLEKNILPQANHETATYDQLAEEMMELHLAMRGKHPDSQAMELLEIASIAITMFLARPEEEQVDSLVCWMMRHGAMARRL